MRRFPLLLTIVCFAACRAYSAEPEQPAAPVPLAHAIAAFNEKAPKIEFGKDQPALTEEEVLAAIGRAKHKDFPESPEPTFAAFKNIAQTREIPAGGEFEVLTGFDGGGIFLTDAWSVRIMLKKPDGGTYSFIIRDTVIRRKTVHEAADEAEKNLQGIPPMPGGYRLNDRAHELRSRADRLDPSGTWEVSRTLVRGKDDEQKSEFTLTLKWEGEKLTGRVTWPDGDEPREEAIQEPVMKDGEFSFHTHRGGFTADYRGKITGDTMSGSFAIVVLDGTWEARRVPRTNDQGSMTNK